MQARQVIDEAAQFLLAAFPDAATFYDERASLVHTILQGVIEVATDEADYATYYVSLDNGSATVRRDPGEMDEDDYLTLASTLSALAEGVRSERILKDTDMKDVARQLLDLLFGHPALGVRPAKAPALKKNSVEIARTINAVLKKAKRQAEFEWKEWAGIGVRAVNKLAPLKALGVTLAAPDEAVRRQVMASDNFSGAVLAWFGEQLAPHGLMLLAISPLDELQQFSLMDAGNIAELQALFARLNIATESAPGVQP